MTFNLRREILKKLTVIVPAYNEGKTITETVINLQALKGYFDEKRIDFKVYVIDDGSTDDTGEKSHQAGADRVVRHKVNTGLGSAVRSGLLAARSDGAGHRGKV